MIKVSPLIPCDKNQKWRWEGYAYLMTDQPSPRELHEFADRLGLQRFWFRKTSGIYTISPGMRAKAIRQGAISLTKEESEDLFRTNFERRHRQRLMDAGQAAIMNPRWKRR